jgi:hypothetical protein
VAVDWIRSDGNSISIPTFRKSAAFYNEGNLRYSNSGASSLRQGFVKRLLYQLF